MELNDDKKMLPKRSLIFSKRMVALAVALIAVGVAIVLSPWGYGKVFQTVLSSRSAKTSTPNPASPNPANPS